MGLRIAALYDVHGNLPALDAVLADLQDEGVDLVIFGGDLVLGPWPAETLARASSLGDRARFIHGNSDTLATTGATPRDRWVRDRLDSGQISTISSWPQTLSVELDGLGPTLFCHATPRSEDETVSPEAPPETWGAVLAGTTERLVICGHTHVQFDRTIGEIRLINPGSVGAPTGRPVAFWAILSPGVELRSTEYDTEAAIAAAQTTIPNSPFDLSAWLRNAPTYEERIASLAASS
jgi:putative phosphoesterase